MMDHGTDTSTLDRTECLQRLGSAPLGRLGLSDRALPIIVPVLFKLSADTIRFRATRGIVARVALEGHIVCFEVDAFDPDLMAGWSVVVTGQLQIDPAEGPRADPTGWSPGVPGLTVHLPTTVMSGRALLAK